MARQSKEQILNDQINTSVIAALIGGFALSNLQASARGAMALCDCPPLTPFGPDLLRAAPPGGRVGE